MKNLLKTLIVSVVALAATYEANAWGFVGHATIAYIADHHLTPEAKQKCEHYLKHTITYYCSWMDQWRHAEGFEETTYWHMDYVDSNGVTTGRGKNGDRSAVIQSVRIIKEMKDYKNLPDSIVADNLKYLIHMIGDMHCPSHVGWPKGVIKLHSINVNGKKHGNHKFWDASPMIFHPKWNTENYRNAIDTYTPKQIKKISKGNPYSWSPGNVRNARAGAEMWESGDEFRDLTAEERQTIEDYMNEQLIKASYRLAAVLNNIFKK